MANTRFFLDTRNAKPGAPCVLKIAIAQKKKTAYISLDAKLVPEKEWDSDKVFDGRGVTELRFLCYSDKLLDVVPITLKERSVIRNGVICAIDGRNTADDSKLAAFKVKSRGPRVKRSCLLALGSRLNLSCRSCHGEVGSSRSISSICERSLTAFRQLA